jgi:hypothetical protein
MTNAPLLSPGVPSSSMALTRLTVAKRGPFRISATSASTASLGPQISASTVPSDRLRTQPVTTSLRSRATAEFAIADALDVAFDQSAWDNGASFGHGALRCLDQAAQWSRRRNWRRS